MTEAIGGYFELELAYDKEYHYNAIRLNTGRNSFEYILRAHRYNKVYLPYYTCEVMLEPIKKMSLEYQFYTINDKFEPIFDFSQLESDAVFVYTNYFGLTNEVCLKVSEICTNLIIDNSQAFYSFPLKHTDTFYSPRKFFGIPDGAYLYTNEILDMDLKIDLSYERMGHLLGRIDKSAEDSFLTFQENDNSLANQSIKQMSRLTHRLLSSIDYQKISQKRKQNFDFFHSKFSDSNHLKFNLKSDWVPMIYPYLVDNGSEIKKQLIKHKIYLATYWPNVKDRIQENTFENQLVENLLALPVDQRYGTEELNFIYDTISSFNND